MSVGPLGSFYIPLGVLRITMGTFAEFNGVEHSIFTYMPAHVVSMKKVQSMHIFSNAYKVLQKQR